MLIKVLQVHTKTVLTKLGDMTLIFRKDWDVFVMLELSQASPVLAGDDDERVLTQDFARLFLNGRISPKDRRLEIVCMSPAFTTAVGCPIL